MPSDDGIGFVPRPAPVASSDDGIGFVARNQATPADDGLGFVATRQAPFEHLERKFADLDYNPTNDEILRYQALEKGKFATDLVRYQLDPEFRIDKSLEFGGKVLEGGLEFAKETGKGLLQSAFLPQGMALPSVAEGLARGIRNSGVQLMGLAKYFPDVTPEGEEPLTPEEKQQWALNYFRLMRKEKRQSSRLAEGKERLLPEEAGPVLPAIAETSSLAADPLMYLAPEVGATAKGASVLRRGMAGGLSSAGHVAEVTGEKILQGGRALTEKATKIGEAIAGAGTEEAGIVASNVRSGMVGAGVTALGALGIANPGAIIPGVAVAATPYVLKRGGQALSAAGRNFFEPSFSHQLGLLGNIARDPAAAEWVRATARFARPVDPLLSAGGRGIEGAFHGAPVAGALTAAMGGDSDQVAQAMGAGMVMGAGGRMVAGAMPGARRAGMEADVTRWKSSLTPETVASLEAVLPDFNQQLRVLNTQRFISGLGDVDFQYLTGKEWKDLGNPEGRALQATRGDRPVVQINLDAIGRGEPVLHESGHVLRTLMPEQFRELDRTLFSDFTTPEGRGTDFATGSREVTGGLFSAEQQQRFYDQYFSKLDKATQEDRRATWSKADHLQSLRDEITSELFSALLQDKQPDFLMRLGPGRQWLKDKLILSGRRALIDRIPFLNQIGMEPGRAGSDLFTVNGRPLAVDARTGAQLRQILRSRDRVTRQLQAGPENDLVGATAVVRPIEMMGRDAAVIARVYGNSDTYRKDAAGNVEFSPNGKPVLLDEGGVRRLSQQRLEAVSNALGKVPAGPAEILVVNGRELHPMTLQENGKSWKGHYYTEAQLAGIERDVARNLVTPRQLADIKRINADIKSGTGIRKAIDYNPATREKGQTGRRGYASMGSKAYETVPLGFFVNREGGMGFDAFDLGSASRKLTRWSGDARIKPQLKLWNGDTRAVMADVYKYLDNQRQGLPNSLHLDPDPTIAVQKRNLITDLLGGERAKDALGGSTLSTKAGRDNAWKSFRIDRLNEMLDSGGEHFPVDYPKVKANLMPESRPPVEVPGQESLPRERRIVAPEGGSPILGTLDDKVASKAGLPVAPIYLQRGYQEIKANGDLGKGFGYEHIVRGHGAHIAHAGFPDLWDFVQGAVSGYTDAWLQSNGRIRLVGRVNKSLAAIELMPDQSGYTVVTAYPVKEAKGEGTLLWSEGPISQTSGSERTSPTSTAPSTNLTTTQDAGAGGSGVAAALNKLAEPKVPVNDSPLPAGVTPSAVIRHIEAQATQDMRAYLIGGGAPALLAEQLAAIAWKKAERGARRSGPAPHERAMAMRAAERLKSLLPEDYEAIRAATLKGGMKGAAEELERRLLVAALRK